jgi:mono/diheme cytochrome c family protein
MRVFWLSTRSGSNAQSTGARDRAPVARLLPGLLREVAIAAAAAAVVFLAPALAQTDTPPSPDTAAEAQVKPPEASSADIDGETMFATTCGFCHESGGRIAGKGPKLSNSKRSDEFMINRIKNGKPGAMPAFGHAFSDGQIMAILAYIRGLDE